MAYDYEGRGKDVEVKGSIYRIPKDEDIADAPLAFEDYTNSIPFSEYVEVIEVDSDTTVDNSYNGKMIVATAPIELTLNDDLSDGFTVAAVAESDATIEYFGVDKQGQSTSEYEVATVVTVNGTNILSVARAGSSTPECPECPDEGADLIGGVAGWAAIESVTGAADLQDLKDAGIAPDTADPDLECEGTYNITQDGVVWRVAVFTGDGSVSTSDGVVDALVVGGGGGDFHGGGGRVVPGIHKFTGITHTVNVGKGNGSNAGRGGQSLLSTIKAGGGISTGGAGGGSQNKGNMGGGPAGTGGAGGGDQGDSIGTSGGPGYQSSITGAEIEFARGGGTDSDAVLKPGCGAKTGSGADGIVIVRAPKDAANNPKPDAPVAWGKFNSVPADATGTGDWGPDAQGRTWKYYEFADAGDFEIDLSGGQYWVLTVNGGNTYKSSNGGGEHNGRPGDVFEGYWEFPTNSATPITVGKAGGPGALSASTAAGGSTIGAYGSQTWGSRWGDASSGMGNQNPGGTGSDGYKSMIRGIEGEFSTAVQGAAVPGRAGTSNASAKPGCVIIATVTNDETEWNPPGSLPGIGGWATVTEIKGKGTKYEYGDWAVFEWYSPDSPTSPKTGTVTTTGGIVDCLVVGSGIPHIYATCADVTHAEIVFPAGPLDIMPGYGGVNTAQGDDSDTKIVPQGATDLQRQIVVNSGYTAYFDGTNGRNPNGQYSSITGTEVLYGHCVSSWPSGDIPAGWGGVNGQSTPGAVIVRVPRSSDNSGLEGSEAGTPFDTTTLREALRETATEKVKSNRKRRK